MTRGSHPEWFTCHNNSGALCSAPAKYVVTPSAAATDILRGGPLPADRHGESFSQARAGGRAVVKGKAP